MADPQAAVAAVEAASSAPGWIAFAVAAVGVLGQVLTALVQRPREKKAAADAAAQTLAELTVYVDQELAAARAQFSTLRDRTGSMPGVVAENITSMDRDLRAVMARLGAVERIVYDLARRCEVASVTGEQHEALQEVVEELRRTTMDMRVDVARIPASLPYLKG